MPIDFGPPSAQVQPYQITPTQYTDPLETLARMQQMRTANLQQQNAQLQLQQAQMKLDSQKGVIRWLAENPPGATQETQPAAPAEPSPAPPTAATPQPPPFVIPSVPGAIGAPTIVPAGPTAAPATAQTPLPSAPATAPQTPSSDSSFLCRMARDASKYGILPEDWLAIQNHYLEYKQKSATLTEQQQKIESDNAEALAGAYRQLAQKKDSDQGDLNAVNNGLIARGVPREWLMTAYPVTHGDMTPQMQIQAQGNSRLKLAQMQEGEQKEAQLAQTKATTQAETMKGTETAGNLAAREIQSAMTTDPQTGEVQPPDPATYGDIQKRYPQVKLPAIPTVANLNQFIRSTVPVKEQPEYMIKAAEASAIGGFTPERLSGMVGGSIDPKKYPEQYQRTLNDATNALQMGLGAKGVAAAIKDGSDRIAQRENAIAQAQITNIPFREAALQNQQFQQLNSSYQFHAGELDKLATPVFQLQGRVQRLNDTLEQRNMQADALIGPELLSVIAGGAGSGLRMTDAEIGRSVGGRTEWEKLKADLQKWSLDPKTARSITPAQDKQIHALVDAVSRRANEEAQILTTARRNLATATGPEQHRLILSDTQDKLQRAVTQGPGAGGPPPGSPAGAVAVPLKSGTTLWLTPAAAAQLRRDHPDRVK